MSTTGISADVLQQLSPQVASTVTKKNDQIDKAGFLQLFIAQLQNQDPQSPMDPSELTSQLAQLTSVEQLTGINDRLDKLTGTSKQNYGSSLLAMIGKDVRFDSSQVSVEGGSASRATYKLAASAAQVKVSVIDSTGKTVRTVDLGDQTAGNHVFAWDGKTDRGVRAADGTYKVKISATVGGQPVNLAVEAEGTVDGVDLSSDPPVLLVNGARLSLDTIKQVRTPAAS